MCDRFAPYLAGFAGGELRGDTSRMIDAHLGSCAECRTEVTRQQRVIGGLRHLGVMTIAPPVAFVDEVMERVHSHERLGSFGAALPLPLANTTRRLVADDRIRRAASATLGAAGVATETRARQAATATAALAAGGLVAIGARRRKARRIATT